MSLAVRYFFCICFCLFLHTCISQVVDSSMLQTNLHMHFQPTLLNTQWKKDRGTNYISAIGYFGAQSNTIGMNISYSLLLNRYIDESAKQKTYKRMNDVNAYEDEAGWALQYAHNFKNKHWTLYAGYQYRNTRSITTNKEAFQLLFSGNKMFEGDTATLHRINFNYLAYNQLQIGVAKQWYKNTHEIQIGATLSLLQSPQYLHLEAKNSSIYTAPYGEYLDITYNMKAQTANTGAPEFFSFKGTGMSAAFNVMYTKPNKYAIRFNVSDIGFIRYNREIHQYMGDSAIHFEGIEIDNILQFTTPNVFNNFNSDSLFRILNIESNQKPYTYIHPVDFQLSYSTSLLKNKALVSIGVRQKTIARYFPYVWSRFSYNCGRNFIPTLSIGVGGMAYYHVGIELQKWFGPLEICFGSNDIPGLIVGKNSTSASLYFRTSVVF